MIKVELSIRRRFFEIVHISKKLVEKNNKESNLSIYIDIDIILICIDFYACSMS